MPKLIILKKQVTKSVIKQKKNDINRILILFPPTTVSKHFLYILKKLGSNLFPSEAQEREVKLKNIEISDLLKDEELYEATC